MSSRNPIRHTVSHFLEAGELRWLRKQKKLQKQTAKRPKKSNFVAYFESLENRGPVSISDTHGRWTKAVRSEMTKAGTWPSPQAVYSLSFIAEYMSRLQRQFWNEHPHLKWYGVDIFDHLNELRPTLKIFKRIFLKIRDKGMRDGTYNLHTWQTRHTVQWTYVRRYHDYSSDSSINIRPFTEFNNHGAGI